MLFIGSLTNRDEPVRGESVRCALQPQSRAVQREVPHLPLLLLFVLSGVWQSSSFLKKELYLKPSSWTLGDDCEDVYIYGNLS